MRTSGSMRVTQVIRSAVFGAEATASIPGVRAMRMRTVEDLVGGDVGRKFVVSARRCLARAALLQGTEQVPTCRGWLASTR